MFINYLNISDTLMIIENFINDNKLIFIILIILLILSVVLGNIKAKKKKKQISHDMPHNDPALSNNIAEENKEQIGQLAYKLITELKIAKMNYDADKIRSITTDNIYDLYKTQIETLQSKKQKNMIQNINYVKSYITSFNHNSINLRIIIECFDFIIDNKNNVIKGKYNQKVLQTYEIEITKNNSNQYLIQKLELLYERAI